MSDDATPRAGEMPGAEAALLTGLLNYQEGATVSRILAKRKGGSVTLFAFDKNQSLSEHTAPFDALVQVLEGKVELTIGGREVTAVPGQLVLMPANVPHALHAREPLKMLLTMLRDS